MIRRSPRGPRQLRSVALAAVAAMLVSLAVATPSHARTPFDTDCAATTDVLAVELCLAQTEASATEDPGLGVDEIDSSPNLRQIANLPKPAPFDTQSALNSDLAFQGKYAFVGNYNGFVIYDIGDPRQPRLVSQVVCVGAQNDITVYDDLLFLSTDSSRSDDSCASTSQSASIKESWEGIKIFDIRDKTNPRYIKSVETNCGSHTHTLVPAKNRRSVYLYVSSYSPSTNFPDCQPPHDLISVIKVPLRKPTDAAVVAVPNLFPDGGNPGGNGSSTTTGCHDITAYPQKDLAAGACMGDGVLMDISDREAPRVIHQVRDTTNFAFWHSATFNNSGTKVVFTDELGGGGAATCNETIGLERGADAVYDITGRGDDRELVFRSYFKIPRTNAATENCVAHNGSLIPVLGRDIMVQAWYQGGVSVWDFTNSANPVEIAYWERGPLSDERMIAGGPWSTYYYNGYIYSSDIQKGLDVLEIRDWRTASAKLVRMHELNVQTQSWYLSW
ncbi:LVIVD repeat-containing protein [Solwaraspora sp. WMMB335]|uniref:LVIVD repeat-containing protein n=1 Tax=Solwaraspora sp. WMMB335 TaxID=3404118 RepID=UPI003B93D798